LNHTRESYERGIGQWLSFAFSPRAKLSLPLNHTRTAKLY